MAGARMGVVAGWVLDPRTPEAHKVALLTWLMLAIAGVVFVIVLALLAAGLRGRHRLWFGPERWVIAGGLVMPTVVLLGLSGMTIWALDADTGTDRSLVIQVVGHQYWWEIRYPDSGAVTANEMVVPAGRPVTLDLTSADVIHSFWVPELGPKRDLVPGRVNHLSFTVRQPADLRGVCAEFCGLEHARMALRVQALDTAAFDTWLAGQAAPAPAPSTPSQQAGLETFRAQACSSCHAIRGVVDNPVGLIPAGGRDPVIGPDLTHLASRSTLAALTLPNDRGHLGGWIGDPQSAKPGNLMPAVPLDPQELLAVLDYLQSLQ